MDRTYTSSDTRFYPVAPTALWPIAWSHLCDHEMPPARRRDMGKYSSRVTCIGPWSSTQETTSILTLNDTKSQTHSGIAAVVWLCSIYAWPGACSLTQAQSVWQVSGTPSGLSPQATHACRLQRPLGHTGRVLCTSIWGNLIPKLFSRIEKPETKRNE